LTGHAYLHYKKSGYTCVIKHDSQFDKLTDLTTKVTDVVRYISKHHWVCVHSHNC